MNNNNDVFLKQMKGVNPIKKNNRVRKENPKITYKSLKKTKVKEINTISTNPDKIIKKSEFNLERVNIKKSIKKGSFNIDKKIEKEWFFNDIESLNKFAKSANKSKTLEDSYATLKIVFTLLFALLFAIMISVNLFK